MSCFAGKLKEYPCFSVDCFDKNNLESNVYFLSHCHRDHMNGLDSPAFLNRLKSSQSVFVYCSETTRNILLCDLKYKHLEAYVVGLPIEHPTMITVSDDLTGQNEIICVTLLPAGHCIGSVMFLFEGNNGTVLYTGDFRLSRGDASRIPFFHSGDSDRPVTALGQNRPTIVLKYNDNKGFGTFRWLRQGPNYYVSLLCKGMYGYEYLLKEVAMSLKTKIHVSPERLKLYYNLPDMAEHFTIRGETTKIHSCNWERDRHVSSKLPCGLTLPAPQQMKVLKIKASSMWFARRKEPMPTDCVVQISENFYRVVHSMHASMEEPYVVVACLFSRDFRHLSVALKAQDKGQIQLPSYTITDLVSYLRPLHVYPTVEPAGLYTIKQTEESLEQFTRCRDTSKMQNSVETQFRKNAVGFESQTLAEEMPASCGDQKLSILSFTKESRPSEEVLAQCKELGLVNDSLAAAPRRRRRRNQTVPRNSVGDEKLFQEKQAMFENHPHKRRILRDARKGSATGIEKSSGKETNCQAVKHLTEENIQNYVQEDATVQKKADASNGASLQNSSFSLQKDVLSGKFLAEDRTSDRVSEDDIFQKGYEEGCAGIAGERKGLSGDIQNESEICIPGSPDNAKPTKERLGAMLVSLRGDMLQVSCLQES